MKKAFTLAEIMIVLVVIGILTAILLPSAWHSVPDENIMKFKKANATLYRVINELVSSDKYYTNGYLSSTADTITINAKTLCETFSDVISTTLVNCTDASNLDTAFVDARDPNDNWKSDFSKFEGNPSFVDTQCMNSQASVGDEIVATDGTVYFDPSPQNHYKTAWTCNENPCQLFSTPDKTEHSAFDTGMDSIYKTFCIDIDGKDGEESPFGYGIRADGKILPGGKAKEWLKKSITSEE